MEISQKIRKQIVAAINDYDMIADGDRILVAVSGGKDSTVLAMMLQEIKRRAKIHFDFDCLLVDQKQPGFNATAFKEWMLSALQIDVKILEEDTYSVVTEKTAQGKSYCGLCSRLRRGILYTYASNHGYSKIALGHHRDDLNETILMNMFYSGKIASMPPKLFSDDKKNIVIRPMAYVAEEHIKKLADDIRFPIIPCNLCGSQTGLKRVRIKKLLSDLRREDENIDAKILASLQNVRPSQLLDRSLNTFSF